MPSLAPSVLIKAITNAMYECNASVLLISPVRGNPKKFLIQVDRQTYSLWIYVWTLTHGGGAARPKNEFRIQITGVRPPLELNPEGFTVLLGYESNLGCFAGFDLEKHRVFSTNSPSIQIPITSLNDALQFGLSFVTKSNEEIAIAVRPDQLLSYCLNAQDLHDKGSESNMMDLLSRAASQEAIQPVELEKIESARRRIVNEVSRLSRDSSFRRKVIAAYEYRCAVTRMQLRLVEAAHILPVGAEGSNDAINNGISLSPTYHRAFDQALIYLDESLVMRINPEREQELISTGFAGGLTRFKESLGTRIHLPQDKSLWPSLALIQTANRFRNIQ